MAPSFLLGLALALTLTLFTATVSSACFDPNGFEINYDEFSECSNTASCCALNRANAPGGDYEAGKPRDECLPNGLCQWRARYQGSAFTQYWRNFCQYDDWGGGRCANVCTQSGPDGETWSELTPCDGTNTSERWCCGNSTACCNGSGDDVVVLAQTLAAFQPTSTTRTRNARTSSASRTEFLDFTTSTGGFSSGGGSDSSSSGKRGGLSVGAKAGIGVGAGVGALLLLGLGFFLAKVRQWKRASDQAKQNEQPPNMAAPSYTPPPVAAPGLMVDPSTEKPAVHGHEISGNVLNEAPNKDWSKPRQEMP